MMLQNLDNMERRTSLLIQKSRNKQTIRESFKVRQNRQVNEEAITHQIEKLDELAHKGQVVRQRKDYKQVASDETLDNGDMLTPTPEPNPGIQIREDQLGMEIRKQRTRSVLLTKSPQKIRKDDLFSDSDDKHNILAHEDRLNQFERQPTIV